MANKESKQSYQKKFSGNRAKTPHKSHKSPDKKIDVNSKYKKKASSFGLGQRKFTVEEFENYVAEFLVEAFDEKNELPATRTNFMFWLQKKHGAWISYQTLVNYGRYEKYKEHHEAAKALIDAQRAQLEKRSLFSVIGMSGPMLLMLKNVGYEDKVVNQNVEMPKFSFEENEGDDEDE